MSRLWRRRASSVGSGPLHASIARAGFELCVEECCRHRLFVSFKAFLLYLLGLDGCGVLSGGGFGEILILATFGSGFSPTFRPTSLYQGLRLYVVGALLLRSRGQCPKGRLPDSASSVLAGSLGGLSLVVVSFKR